MGKGSHVDCLFGAGVISAWACVAQGDGQGGRDARTEGERGGDYPSYPRGRAPRIRLVDRQTRQLEWIFEIPGGASISYNRLAKLQNSAVPR